MRIRTPHGGSENSLSEHLETQAPLNEPTISADAVRACTEGLSGFLRRDLPRFHRTDQRDDATLVIHGLRGGLGRRTTEPIAIEAGLARKPIRFFVGVGRWGDETVMAELQLHVRDELAESEGVVVIDPGASPK